MISYELYCQIRLLHQERGLNFAQIARELNLDEETVAKWARAKNYTQPANTLRKSKLDPYKVIIQRWLERHSYTATQIFQRLRAEEGYTGGFTPIVRVAFAPLFDTLAIFRTAEVILVLRFLLPLALTLRFALLAARRLRAVALMTQITTIRLVELLAAEALALGRTLHGRTQKFEPPSPQD